MSENKHLLNSTILLPWYKYYHHGQHKAPNVPSLNLEQEGRDQVFLTSL